MPEAQDAAHGVALLGAGKMAEAMIAGWLASGELAPARIRVTNRRNDQRLAELRERYGVAATRNRQALLDGATALIVAVKPADVAEALLGVRDHVRPDLPVISVAAGVQAATIRDLLGRGQVVRTMPNTACRIRQSATAICGADGCSLQALAYAEWLFGLVGTTARVPEAAFDVVTAVAGSGPAYAYLLAEAMEKAARELGLSGEVARRLVATTLLGAGQMLETTGFDPAVLREQVTSPGGTTAAALQVLIGEADVPGAVCRAVKRATERAGELAALAMAAAARQGASP